MKQKLIAKIHVIKNQANLDAWLSIMGEKTIIYRCFGCNKLYIDDRKKQIKEK